MRYDVYFQFVIRSLDLETGQFYVLSLDEKQCILPSAEFSTKIDKNILKSYININLDWISLKLSYLYVNDNKLYIVYTGEIPIQTNLKKAFWIRLDEVKQHLITQGFLWA